MPLSPGSYSFIEVTNSTKKCQLASHPIGGGRMSQPTAKTTMARMKMGAQQKFRANTRYLYSDTEIVS